MEDKKIKKSAKKIKEQIEHWFIKYHCEPRDNFDGTEVFTLFDLIENRLKQQILEKIELGEIEIPVLVLKVTEDNFIVNTTERFIKIENLLIEELDYKNFSCFNGYEEMRKMKVKGEIANFRLVKTDGEIIYWKIPTGAPGIAFWNVTKKCALIGRKYNIVK